MLGHVNALGGNKGVFADLRKLTPGAEINVSRADGSTAVFTVDRGALYPKNEFPTLEVYGNTHCGRTAADHLRRLRPRHRGI